MRGETDPGELIREDFLEEASLLEQCDTHTHAHMLVTWVSGPAGFAAKRLDQGMGTVPPTLTSQCSLPGSASNPVS